MSLKPAEVTAEEAAEMLGVMEADEMVPPDVLPIDSGGVSGVYQPPCGGPAMPGAAADEPWWL
jgi:hypothetical protein